MKILLIDKNAKRTVEYQLGTGTRMLAIASLCLLPFIFGFGGYALAVSWLPATAGEQVGDLRLALSGQKQTISEIRAEAQRKVDALSVRVAQLQARLMRLDALGERVAEVAKFDKDEFDFNATPAVGGMSKDAAALSPSLADFETTLAHLEHTVESREQQLGVISQLLKNRDLSEQIKVDGWPVEKGWISSLFGARNDPFTGKVTPHYGIDFASKLGSPVKAVAAGVVTWSGYRNGYGLTVEVNHGGGYMTRYAHNSENVVVVGQLVKKDDAIAKVGTSGRSTGPHLHFEVFKNGRHVDPASYVHRTNRS